MLTKSKTLACFQSLDVMNIRKYWQADNPGSIPGGGAEKENLFSLLLSSASEGTVSRRSSRPRALVARVSCNRYTDLK